MGKAKNKVLTRSKENNKNTLSGKATEKLNNNKDLKK